MKTYKFMKFFGILIAIGMISFALKLYSSISNGELGQKPKYAFLQSLPSQKKDLLVEDKKFPILLLRSDAQPYSVLGMQSKSNSDSLVWIILDDLEDGDIPLKVMPENRDFLITCEYVQSLKRKVLVTSEVVGFLDKKCIHTK